MIRAILLIFCLILPSSAFPLDGPDAAGKGSFIFGPEKPGG